MNTRGIATWGSALLLVALLSAQGSRIHNMDSSDFIETGRPDDLVRALAWSPTSWHVWYSLGRSAVGSADDRNLRFAERCITQATAYDSNNYILWDKLARLRLRMNDVDGAMAAYSRLKSLRSWMHIPELDSLKKTVK